MHQFLVLLIAVLTAACVQEEDVDTRRQGIAGGEYDAGSQHPWVVRLGGYCHGILIHPRWVLTAAHCGRFGPMNVVEAGPESGPDKQGKTSYNTAPYIHPLYATLNDDDDIALIYLDTPFQINRHVQTIALPTGDYGLGDSGHFASYDGLQPPGSVEVYRAPVVPCSSVGTTRFCTRSPTVNTCKGDSGSGFVDYETQGTARLAVVVGIASGGGCDLIQYGNTGYTKVFSYLDWIDETMDLGETEIAGNVTMTRTNLSAGGLMRLDCIHALGFPIWAEGALDVRGARIGLECSSGLIQSTCDTQNLSRDREIAGFTRTTSTETLALDHSEGYAYHGYFEPAIVTPHSYECQLNLPPAVLMSIL